MDFHLKKKKKKSIECIVSFLRNDEKTAADYKIQGGSVLHLVLALRGGCLLHHRTILCSTPAV